MSDEEDYENDDDYIAQLEDRIAELEAGQQEVDPETEQGFRDQIAALEDERDRSKTSLKSCRAVGQPTKRRLQNGRT